MYVPSHIRSSRVARQRHRRRSPGLERGSPRFERGGSHPRADCAAATVRVTRAFASARRRRRRCPAARGCVCRAAARRQVRAASCKRELRRQATTRGAGCRRDRLRSAHPPRPVAAGGRAAAAADAGVARPVPRRRAQLCRVCERAQDRAQALAARLHEQRAPSVELQGGPRRDLRGRPVP